MADMAFSLDLRARVHLESLSVWLVGRYLNNVAGACQTMEAKLRTPEQWGWPKLTPRVMATSNVAKRKVLAAAGDDRDRAA
jgi:hypothetical protein